MYIYIFYIYIYIYIYIYVYLKGHNLVIFGCLEDESLHKEHESKSFLGENIKKK